MGLFPHSDDSTLVDEANLSPRIELPDPTLPVNSYDIENDDSNGTEKGSSALQEMTVGAIEELLETLQAKVKNYLDITGEDREEFDHDDDEAVDEIKNNSRGLDIDGDNLRNERFKVRTVVIGGSVVPVSQVQDNKNGKK